MAEVMAERRVSASVTVADVIAHAGVSTGVFHEAFADREACLLAAFELGVQRAAVPVAAAHDSQEHWLDAIKAALVAFLCFLEDEPALGSLLVVHSLGCGEQVLRRRLEILGKLASRVDRGRYEAPASRRQPPPAVVAEGVVGAVLAVLQNRLLADEAPPLAELYGSLVSLIVLPYFGAAAARRELVRPPPRIRQLAELADVPARGGLKLDAPVRLTHRTARVLSAIADYPGASNREVADRAGVVDQGQISKLLRRLQARGLIEQFGSSRARGAPNAWRLTERGRLALGDANPDVPA